MAPPTPTSPDTNAPTKPSATRRIPRSSVTLPETRVVRREIGERRLRNRLHQRLERRDADVTGIPPVLLEQRHLVGEVARRLAGQARNALGGIPLAVLPVADHALRGGGAAARDRGGVGLHGSWLHGLGGE